MVGAFTKCSRLSHHRSKHHHFVDGGSRISPAAVQLHGVLPLERFEAVEYLCEPVDVDHPARCPPPERSIMRDGLIWKEMVARRSEAGGLPPWRRRIPSSPREKYLQLMSHSAPPE